jgi:hypothetical protein
MGIETGFQKMEEPKKYQEFKSSPLCPMNGFGACKEGRCAWFDPQTRKCGVLLIAQRISPESIQELQ